MGINFLDLPFYSTLSIPLKPKRLVSSKATEVNGSFIISRTFTLEPKMSTLIKEGADLVLRLFAYDTSEAQEDLFPPGLQVTWNGLLLETPPKPLAFFLTDSLPPDDNNEVKVSWDSVTAGTSRDFALGVFILKRMTHKELFISLKSNQVLRSNETKAMIMKVASVNLDKDEDVCAPENVSVSLSCPVSKNRMKWPCRSTSCSHLQCFDAKSYLKMQSSKPRHLFKCPVCDKRMAFDQMGIDQYFRNIVRNFSKEKVGGDMIDLKADGTWLPAKLTRQCDVGAVHEELVIVSDSDNDEVEEMNEDEVEDENDCVVFEPEIQKEASSSSSGERFLTWTPLRIPQSDPEVIILDETIDLDD